VIFSIVNLAVRCLLGCLMVLTRRQMSKDAGLLVLRHENAVLRRQINRVRYQPGDRLWLAALSRQIPRRRWGETFEVIPTTRRPPDPLETSAPGTQPASSTSPPYHPTRPRKTQVTTRIVFRSPTGYRPSPAAMAEVMLYLWFIFILFLPLIGVLVYLIASGGKMNEHRVRDAQVQERELRSYVQEAAGSQSSADQLAKLADLRDRGVITAEEFDREKAKILA